MATDVIPFIIIAFLIVLCWTSFPLYYFVRNHTRFTGITFDRNKHKKNPVELFRYNELALITSAYIFFLIMQLVLLFVFLFTYDAAQRQKLGKSLISFLTLQTVIMIVFGGLIIRSLSKLKMAGFICMSIASFAIICVLCCVFYGTCNWLGFDVSEWNTFPSPLPQGPDGTLIPSMSEDELEDTAKKYFDDFGKNYKNINQTVISVIDDVNHGDTTENDTTVMLSILSAATVLEMMPLLKRMFPGKFKFIGDSMSKLVPKFVSRMTSSASAAFSKNIAAPARKLINSIGSKAAEKAGIKIAEKTAQDLPRYMGAIASGVGKAGSILLTAWGVASLAADIADITGANRHYSAMTDNLTVEQIKLGTQSTILNEYKDKFPYPTVVGPLDNYSQEQLTVALMYLCTYFYAADFKNTIDSIVAADKNKILTYEAVINVLTFSDEEFEKILNGFIYSSFEALCNDPSLIQKINGGEEPTNFVKSNLHGNLTSVYGGMYCSYPQKACEDRNNYGKLKANAAYKLAEYKKSKGEKPLCKYIPVIADSPECEAESQLKHLTYYENEFYTEYKHTKTNGKWDGKGVCVLSDPTMRFYCENSHAKYNATEGICVVDEVYCKKMAGTWGERKNYDEDNDNEKTKNGVERPTSIEYVRDSTDDISINFEKPRSKMDCLITPADFTAEVVGGMVISRDGKASRDYNRFEKCKKDEGEWKTLCYYCPLSTDTIKTDMVGAYKCVAKKDTCNYFLDHNGNTCKDGSGKKIPCGNSESPNGFECRDATPAVRKPLEKVCDPGYSPNVENTICYKNACNHNNQRIVNKHCPEGLYMGGGGQNCWGVRLNTNPVTYRSSYNRCDGIMATAKCPSGMYACWSGSCCNNGSIIIQHGKTGVCPAGLKKGAHTSDCWGIKVGNSYTNLGGCDSPNTIQTYSSCPGNGCPGGKYTNDASVKAACDYVGDGTSNKCHCKNHSIHARCRKDPTNSKNDQERRGLIDSNSFCMDACPPGTQRGIFPSTSCDKIIRQPKSRRRRHITGVGKAGSNINLLMGGKNIPPNAENICNENNIPNELPDLRLQGYCWQIGQCNAQSEKIGGKCYNKHDYTSG